MNGYKIVCNIVATFDFARHVADYGRNCGPPIPEHLNRKTDPDDPCRPTARPPVRNGRDRAPRLGGGGNPGTLRAALQRPPVPCAEHAQAALRPAPATVNIGRASDWEKE